MAQDRNATQLPPLSERNCMTKRDLLFSPKRHDDTLFAAQIAAIAKSAVESGRNMGRFDFAGQKGIVVLDPEVQKEILVTNKKHLHPKESIALFEHHFLEAVMALRTNDPRWRAKRNEITDLVAKFTDDPQKIINLAAKRVTELSEKSEFDLLKFSHLYTASVIFLAAGVDPNKIPADVLHNLVKLIDEGIKGAVTPSSGVKLALENRFYRPTLPSDVTLKAAEKIIDKIVEANKNDIWAEGSDNHLSRQVKSLEACDAKTRARLVNDLCFLLVAGSESTGNNVAFTLLHVITHPEVHEKLMTELNQLGDPATWNKNTFEHTPILDSIVAESLRHTPPLKFQKALAIESFQLKDGTQINKGDHIIFSTSATHHLEKYYKNPHEFNPDREEFRGKDLISLTAKASDMELVYRPFGFGQRGCPGKGVAMLETRVVVAMAFIKCKLSLQERWDVTKVRDNIGSQPVLERPVRVESLQPARRCRL